MVFSSISFLFFFLPILFVIYFLVPKKGKNVALLIFSLAFYFFGEKWYVILLLSSCLVNYLIGLGINRSKNKKMVLITGLVIDIGILVYFKYTNFFIENVRAVFGVEWGLLRIVLPLGISFFTFQNISYLVDVYRGEVKANPSFINYATYITMFPQLIAGPIVRYKDIEEQIEGRRESVEKFSRGIDRFILGLGKKVLIADVMYAFYTSIMASEMATISYWIAAVVYTLHIYYDFSGYSDMAIGLGSMFGFDFKENFDYPLWASSITDFWRKWHMSLSSFFRDYVYIPLGGNRVSVGKNIRNILIVWVLTGLWHGASWNFVLWGLYFFVFLVLEKFVLKSHFKGGIGAHIYTFIVVIISFVIFACEDFSSIKTFIGGLLGSSGSLVNKEILLLLKDHVVILFVAFIGSGPVIAKVLKNLKERNSKVGNVLEIVGLLVVFIWSVAQILSSSFNPFIYFRF